MDEPNVFLASHKARGTIPPATGALFALPVWPTWNKALLTLVMIGG